jgi:CheY-like chemotaxis protein
MLKSILRNPVFKKADHIKVLVVDDQAEIRSLVREVLADAGVTQVYEAQDGKAALQFVDADFDMVNLIICDWNMPGLSGIEFLRQIRTVFPDLPFLLVTGRCDKKSVMEAKMAGVSGYIRKPFSPGQLEEKLRIMMDGVSNHK